LMVVWCDCGMEGWWEGGKEGRREGGKEGWREGGKEGRREGGKEGRREGEKEGRREGVREKKNTRKDTLVLYEKLIADLLLSQQNSMHECGVGVSNRFQNIEMLLFYPTSFNKILNF
jgi:hypothetical protein